MYKTVFKRIFRLLMCIKDRPNTTMETIPFLKAIHHGVLYQIFFANA